MWMFAHLTHLMLSSATLSNKIYCCSFFLFVCLPQQRIVIYSATTRTKKWQEATTMFQYTIGILVHPTQKVLSSATLSNEMHCCSFLVKNLAVCVPSTTADCKLFNNHRNKKVVGGNCNVLGCYENASAPDLEGVVLCNTFK